MILELLSQNDLNNLFLSVITILMRHPIYIQIKQFNLYKNDKIMPNTQNNIFYNIRQYSLTFLEQSHILILF